MNKISIGKFVEYRKGQFMVCQIIGDKAHILSPIHGKRFVNMTNLTYIHKRGACKVKYGKHNYMVTPLGCIISLETNRIMKWKAGHKVRNNILELCHDMGVKHLRTQAI